MLIGIVMVTLLLAGLAIGVGVTHWRDGERRRSTDRLLASLELTVATERRRAEQLQGMLDEAAAAALKVAPPVTAHVGPGLDALPAEILEQLDQLDDDTARAEFEAMIRAQMARTPDKTAREILDAVMP
jgi:hypothetical protein